MVGKSHSVLAIAEKASIKIARDFPEIAEDYAHGAHIPWIVKEYELIGKYGIRSQAVAEKSVKYVLRILLPKETLEDLATHHRSLCGLRQLVNGIGIFGMSAEDKIKLARINAATAKEMAKEQIRLGIGIHSREGKSFAGKQSARARGFNLWDEEQVEYARGLRNNGRSFSQVAYLVNLRYFEGKEVRTRGSVYKALRPRKWKM